MSSSVARQEKETTLASISLENQEILRRYIFPSLNNIETVVGCGRRPCWFCSENGTFGQSSARFTMLEEISALGPPRYQHFVSLYFAGDLVYYNESGKNIADVVKVFVNNGWQVGVRTHGWLESETDAERAATDLISLMEENPQVRDRVAFGYSIDPYGWIGVDQGTHLRTIARNLQLLLPLQPWLYIFCNENDVDANYCSMRYLLRDIIPHGYSHLRTTYEPVYHYGQESWANRLNPLPPYDPGSPWQGYVLKANGDLLHYGHGNPFPQQRGNIYQTIHWRL